MSSLVDVPATRGSPEIDRQFRALLTSVEPLERAEAEDTIWMLWSTHDDADASHAMEDAIGAIAAGDLDNAEAILDALVARCPEWSEAWNKRATLYFLQERDRESVLDIQETLRLEPRHFGAVSGLGQICLRAGDNESAIYVLEFALALNPALESVRQTVTALRADHTPTLH